MVAIGLTDADLLAQLSTTAKGRLLVHAIVQDNGVASTLRTAIVAEGLDGLVTIASATQLTALPYAEQLAEVILTDAAVFNQLTDILALPATCFMRTLKKARNHSQFVRFFRSCLTCGRRV